MVARDIWLQAIEATPLGVLEGSIRKLAVACGPIHAQGKRPTDRQVKAALAQLTAPRGPKGQPIAKWWPDIETLWVIEAADEQVMNDSMWAGLREEILRLPSLVREAILRRYPDATVADTKTPQGRGHSAPSSGDTVTPHPSVQRQRQDQTQGQEPPPPPPPKPSKSPPPNRGGHAIRASAETRASEIVAAIAEAVPPPDGAGPLRFSARTRQGLVTLVESGVTREQVLDVLAWLRGEIDAGRCLPRAWDAAVVTSGFWTPLERREIPETFRPGNAPAKAMTAADALAHKKRTGKLPDGWQHLPGNILAPEGARLVSGQIVLPSGETWTEASP